MVATPTIAQDAEERVQQLTKESSFIFEGTVNKIGASNVADVQDLSKAMVVTVNKVLWQQPGAKIRNLVGSQVTAIQTKSTEQFKSIKEGQSAVFFYQWLEVWG